MFSVHGMQAVKRAQGSASIADESTMELNASKEGVDTTSVDSETSPSNCVSEEGDGENLLSDIEVELQDMGEERRDTQTRTLSFSFRQKPSYKLRKFLLHGSFFCCRCFHSCCRWCC